MMKVAERLNGVGEYYFSAKLREISQRNAQGQGIINLGIGNPDLPPHPDVIRALNSEVARPDVHGYQSYIGSRILREAISNWYGTYYGVSLDPETEILPLIGSKEGIMHLCMTYLDPGDEVLVPDPGYPTYRAAAILAGATCKTYALKREHNFAPDFDAIESEDLSNVKLCFVNYPHMPTGQPPSRRLFEDLVAFAKRNNILLVHDNPYAHILNTHPMSLLSIDGAKECVVELNSISKSHNMAGWRVGMLCGASDRISDVLRFKSNMDSGMFLPLQLAAATALALPSEWYDQNNAVYAKRRELVFLLLDQLGCTYSREQAGLFVWAEVPNTYSDGYALSDAVLEGAHVFLTPGGVFGKMGTNAVRVSLCSPEAKIEECISRIHQWLDQKNAKDV